jgi:nucleoside-diphosphate-sugar epimerase
MDVLVIGGAGYIGMALVRSLIHHGHTVRVSDLQPPAPKQTQEGFEYVPGNLLNPGSLGSSLEGMEAVYHLAWSFYPEDHRREVEENLLGTLNLLEACKAARIRQLIFASSAVVYGPTGVEPACESDPCQPHRSTIGGPVYAVTKLACEYTILASQNDGPAATIMRIHGVFSQDRLAQFSQMIEQATEAKDILAIAQAGGSYALLDDVIWAMCGVLGKDETLGEVYNLAGSRNYLDRDLAGYIAQKARTGSKVVLINDPGEGMISVSVDKLSRTIGYQPCESDFLREFIDARFP